MHAAEEAQHLGLLKAMSFELPLSEYRQRMAAAQGNFQVRDTHHDNQTNTRYCDKHPHSQTINNTLSHHCHRHHHRHRPGSESPRAERPPAG